MRRRRGKRIAPAWTALNQIDDAGFVRVIVAASAMVAAAMVALALMTLPTSGTGVLFIVLAFVVLHTGYRAWRTHATEPPSGTLALLLLLCVFFIVGLPARANALPLRLTHVAAVAFGMATVLGAVLHWRWRVGTRATLIVVAALTGEVVAIEAVAGAFYTAPIRPDLTRAEWAGLTPDTTAGLQARAGQMTWSASAEADSALGIRLPARATLRSLHPSNPRGYFERADLRGDLWELAVAPGSSAKLFFPGDSAQLRVDITEARRDAPGWHIMLNQAGLRVEGEKRYELEFRARADRPRSMVVAVTQARDSFALRGLLETVELTSEWKPFRIYFTATRTERNARIHLALGGESPSVELANVALRDGFTNESIVPDRARNPWTVTYRTNGLGCRGPDPAFPPAGERIMVLGDGFTMGVGVHEGDTFTAQLDSLLGTAVPRSTTASPEVLNCGVPGYGSHEQLAWFTRLAEYRPSTVMLVVSPHDDRYHWEQAQRALQARRHARVAQIFRSWAVLTELRNTRRSHDYGPVIDDVRALQRAVSSAGARLVVVLAPTDRDESWGTLRSALRSLPTGAGIELIDVGDDLARARTGPGAVADSTDSHPDARVHAALARLLAARLSSQGSTTPPAPQ